MRGFEDQGDEFEQARRAGFKEGQAELQRGCGGFAGGCVFGFVLAFVAIALGLCSPYPFR